MHVRVDPDDLTAAGAELSGDGPTLRAAANVLSAHRYAASSDLLGHPVLAAALADLLGSQVASLHTLAEAAQLLAGGLTAAGTAYRVVQESTAALLGRPS